MPRSHMRRAGIPALSLILLASLMAATIAAADEMPDTTEMSPLQRLVRRAQQMGADHSRDAEPVELVLPEGVTRLTHTDGDEGTMSWAPDGKSIYFGYREKSLQEVRRIELDTGEVTTVSLPMESAKNPDISPDGKFMAFERVAAGIGRKVWVMRLEDGEQAKLTQTAGHAGEGEPCWSASGRKVYFTSQGQGTPFSAPMEVTREGERLKSLVESHDREGFSYLRPRVSPTGGKVAWAVRSGRRGFIQVIDRKISTLREEFDFEGYFIGGVDWLPGEREMVVTYLVLDKPLEGYSLGRVNLETGELTHWLNLSGADINPRVSPDGKRVAFTAKVDRHAELFIAELP